MFDGYCQLINLKMKIDFEYFSYLRTPFQYLHLGYLRCTLLLVYRCILLLENCLVLRGLLLGDFFGVLRRRENDPNELDLFEFRRILISHAS